ncbi:MAG TPA: hypothetical protein VGK89_08840 [Candidatus Eisenbacteria bacterium]|jgi:hypothetical protein
MRPKRGDYHGRGPAPAASGGRSPPRATWPGAGAAAVLALAFAIALALRLAPLAAWPGGELAADSAFHLRMIEEVVAHGRTPAIDRMCEAPEGRAIGALLPTGLYHAAAAFHRALAPLDRRDARFHALLFTALAGALIVLPAFFAARAVFAHADAAAAAALVAAVIPAHLHRSHAWWLRYDALGTLLVTVHVAFLLHALAAPDRLRALRSSALAALALVTAVACWRVALLMPFAELSFALAWTAWRGATREVREGFTVVVGLSTPLFLLVPWLRAQSFPLSGAWLAAAAATAALWLPWLVPGRARWPARAVVLALALGAGWGAARLFPRPDPYAPMFALLPAKLALAFGGHPALPPITSLALGIEELTSLSPLGLFGPGALSWLGPWLLAAPFLLAWGAGSRRGMAALTAAPALLTVLCAEMTLVTLLFERNKVLLAPLTAVACGGLAARLADRAWGKPGPRVALAALFALCAAVTTWHAAALAISRRPALAPGLGDALAFLRDSTPVNAIVMGPWEHGYEVQTFARRATVMDGLIESPGNQRRIVDFAEAALMPAADSLAALCVRHGASWLLVPPSTHLYAVALAARAPFAAKVLSGAPLNRAEGDRALVQMMVLGRAYPEFEKVFDRGGYRVYHVVGAAGPRP